MPLTRRNDTSLLAHNKEMILPQVKFVKCPIKTSLGILGKKWTILIIRDIGFRGIGRFNNLLKSIPGLTPRVLSMRLNELKKDGLIECIEEMKKPNMIVWKLTEKGKDTLPILLMMTAFSSKWHSDSIFEDKKPRKLNEIFPQPEAKEIMTRFL